MEAGAGAAAGICQQCKEATNLTDHRLVRDSCGHYKCRRCLVHEIDGCRACAPPPPAPAAPRRLVTVSELQEALLSGRRAAPGGGRRRREPGVLPDNINIETDDSGISYYCTVCEKKFRARSHVAYHAYCDGLVKPHTCTICQKGFASRSHYEYHMRVHEGNRPFICDTCSFGFYQKSKLKRHILKHTGEKRFPCAECGAAFNNAASLRKHGFIHSGEKPHKCATCGKQFRDSSNLRKHETKHQDVKYTCGECGKQYGVKWSLVLHAKSHREARPYRCPQCPQAFYSNKDMRRHAAVHSDNKPYRCTLCGTRFRRKDNLDRHLRNTHPGVDASKSFEVINDLTQDKTSKNKPEINDNLKIASRVKIEWELPLTIADNLVKYNPLPPLSSEQVNQLGSRDYTEQYILEENNKRQTVIFGPMKPNLLPNSSNDRTPSSNNTTSQDEKGENYEENYKYFKKKITSQHMELYRKILVPKYAEQADEAVEKEPEKVSTVDTKPIPEYIHKKVNYELKNELKKRQVYCNQVTPLTMDKIDSIVRQSSFYPKQDDVVQHPPEKIELYKKILVPDYNKNDSSTSNGEGSTINSYSSTNGNEQSKISQDDLNADKNYDESAVGQASQPCPDMHWRRRMALNTNR